MSLEVGSIVEGTVTGITSFGAFIQLPDGQTGLVHISEVADSFVTDVRNHVQDRERVTVKILSADDRGRFELSIRRARSPGLPEGVVRPRRGGGRRDAPAGEGGGFEDLLRRFKKESEERQLDVKRNTEGKRGRGRGR